MSGTIQQSNKKEIQDKIRYYYQKAKEFLERDNYSMAFDIIYKEMPVELYDISLDMWSNRNIEKTEETRKLINLIEEVDDKLNPNDSNDYS